MRNLQLGLLLALAASSMCGCASAYAPRPTMAKAAVRRALDETSAVALLDELLLEARLPVNKGWQVTLPDHHPLRVDLRVGDSPVGIEWVSAVDRARYGSALPSPDPDGQLRVVTVSDAGNARPALVLLLDARSYEYTADMRAVQWGVPDQSDVEARLHHDLLDFLAFAGTQYPL